MPCTYILFSQKLDKYYIGACTNLDRRLYEHNIGHTKFTKTGMPWELKYFEAFSQFLPAIIGKVGNQNICAQIFRAALQINGHNKGKSFPVLPDDTYSGGTGSSLPFNGCI